MAKTIDGVIGFVGTPATNYIQQINDGTTTHDIAVKSGITFFNGAGDETGFKWDGVQELEVVIPTLSDIVANPVVLKGIINDPATETPRDPQNGWLVYIGTDGITFGGQVCEAGDMAVYYNNKWNVIQGENQVSLVGTAEGNVVTADLSGIAQNVLTVEGKNLALKIDYNDVNSHLSVSKNDTVELPVDNASVEVSAKHIGLVQADATNVTIGVEQSIALPSALASGAVTISDKVLASGDFTFTSGSFPTISKNADAITVSASHSMKVVASGEGSFVTDITAIKGITFGAGSSLDKDFEYVASLSENSGASFVNGVHSYTAEDEGKTADFTIWGEVTATASTFVTGLSDTEAATGDVVTSVNVGNVTLAEGTGILTGLSGNGSSVVTSVSVGTLGSDSTKNWFFSGLSEGSEVVKDVVFDTYSLAADTNGGAAAIVSASVSDHVLSFNTSNFQTPVTLSKTAGSVSKTGFTTAGVTLTGTNVTTDTFTTASLSQATTTVSFKNILTGNVALTQTSTKYFFDKAASTSYSAVKGYVKTTPVAADVTKNGAVLSDTTITATIPANTVAVGLNEGTLPTLTIDAPSTTISGTVGTSLTTSNVSWLAVASTASEISIPGEVSLSVVTAGTEGAVSVASEGTYTLSNGASVTIASNSFLTGASILVNNQ